MRLKLNFVGISDFMEINQIIRIIYILEILQPHKICISKKQL